MKKLVKKILSVTMLFGLFISGASAKENAFDQVAYDKAYNSEDYSTCIDMLSAVDDEKNYIKNSLDVDMLLYFLSDYQKSGEGFVASLENMENTSSGMTAGQIIGASVAGENAITYSGSVYEFLLAYSMNAVNALKLGDESKAMGAITNYIQFNQDTISPLLQKQKELEQAGADLLDSNEFKTATETLKKNYGVDIPLLDWTNNLPPKAESTYETSPFLSYLGTVIYALNGDKDHADEFSKILAHDNSVDVSEIMNILSDESDKGYLDVIALSGVIGQRSESVYEPTPLDLTLCLNSAGVMSYSGIPIESHLFLNYKIAYPSFNLKKQNHAISRVVVKLSDGNSKTATLIEDFDKAVKNDVDGKARAAYYRSMFRNVTKSVGTIGGGAASVIGTDKALAKAGKNPIALKAALVGYNKAAKPLQEALNALTDSEKADVRQAAYLPNKASATGFSVAPGTYTVTVEYLNDAGKVIGSETIPNVKVEAGKVAVAVSSCKK